MLKGKGEKRKIQGYTHQHHFYKTTQDGCHLLKKATDTKWQWHFSSKTLDENCSLIKSTFPSMNRE